MLNKENFLQEIKAMKTGTIAEQSKQLNLPIIVFGASEHAEFVTEKLSEYGVEVSGYAVDEKFYKQGQIYRGLPVYNFDDLIQTPKKYIFVNGIGGGYFNRIRRFDDDESILKYDITSKVAQINYDYVLENYQRFFETYNLLDDDFSRKTLLAYLKAQITENPDDIRDVVCPAEYFNEITKDAMAKRNYSDGCFIDCGAFIGDTVKGFIKWNGENYKKVFAFEPDPENFIKLENLIKENNYKNIEIFNCGVWNEKTQLHFNANGVGSCLTESGDITVNVDSIDNIVGDNRVNFIKMDIEGAELSALQGAIKTLERDKPILAICVYHKADDLFVLPQFIKNIYKDCRFYLRKHKGVYLHSLDLYVIPD